ncbi:hypothetical protein PSACC_02587 [Paramicrosporidium saccamoebae]|uniref:Uncharacterized protein n=1 Tax=Paramicrosporidium saccamoebae TaxID=1246581 RepID=A0A2H9TIH8_9FUNG|nr:hypothetical protein PSACC_02587 [Paramicrosporidium saccamoebae]
MNSTYVISFFATIISVHLVSLAWQTVHILRWKPKYNNTGRTWSTLLLPICLAVLLASYCRVILKGSLSLFWIQAIAIEKSMGGAGKWPYCFMNLMPFLTFFAVLNFGVGSGFNWTLLMICEMSLRLGIEFMFALLFTRLSDWGWMGLVIQLVIQLVVRIGIFAVFPLQFHFDQPLKRDASTEKVFQLCERQGFPVTGLAITEKPGVFYQRNLLTERIYIDKKTLAKPEHLWATVTYGLGCRVRPIQVAAFVVLPGLINLLLSFYILNTGAFYDLFGFTKHPGVVFPPVSAITISSIVMMAGVIIVYPLASWYIRNTIYTADRFVAAYGGAAQMIEHLQYQSTRVATACKWYEYFSSDDASIEARIDRLHAESFC